jgi:hypothetical protein
VAPHSYTILLGVLAIVSANVGIYFAIKTIYSTPHSVDGESQVFRYSPIVAWTYILGPPLVGVVAFLTAYGPTLSPVVDSPIAEAISALSVGLLSLVGIWYRSFSITVDHNGLVTRSIFRKQSATFSELQTILVTGYPTKTLVVTAKSGKRVFSAYGDLQDFGDLIYLLKSKSAEYHVEAKIRDKWGGWSEI